MNMCYILLALDRECRDPDYQAAFDKISHFI